MKFNLFIQCEVDSDRRYNDKDPSAHVRLKMEDRNNENSFIHIDQKISSHELEHFHIPMNDMLTHSFLIALNKIIQAQKYDFEEMLDRE